MSTTSLRELVEHLARQLVDTPDAVTVEEVPEGDEIVLELRVAQQDLGKVIGKAGRTARALRTVLSAAAMKSKQRVVLEIVE